MESKKNANKYEIVKQVCSEAEETVNNLRYVLNGEQPTDDQLKMIFEDGADAAILFLTEKKPFSEVNDALYEYYNEIKI